MGLEEFRIDDPVLRTPPEPISCPGGSFADTKLNRCCSMVSVVDNDTKMMLRNYEMA